MVPPPSMARILREEWCCLLLLLSTFRWVSANEEFSEWCFHDGFQWVKKSTRERSWFWQTFNKRFSHNSNAKLRGVQEALSFQYKCCWSYRQIQDRTDQAESREVQENMFNSSSLCSSDDRSSRSWRKSRVSICSMLNRSIRFSLRFDRQIIPLPLLHRTIVAISLK